MPAMLILLFVLQACIRAQGSGNLTVVMDAMSGAIGFSTAQEFWQGPERHFSALASFCLGFVSLLFLPFCFAYVYTR